MGNILIFVEFRQIDELVVSCFELKVLSNR
jgi:hypothetical protein